MNLFLPCFYSFMGCMGFCLLFNIRGRKMVLASLGGALGWLVFLLTKGFGSNIVQSFFAIVVISVYAEILARMTKVPVTVYLIVSLIPLVPGEGIYRTMEYCIGGDMSAFLRTGLHTFGVAGALALGIILVSSLMRLYKTIRQGC